MFGFRLLLLSSTDRYLIHSRFLQKLETLEDDDCPGYRFFTVRMDLSVWVAMSRPRCAQPITCRHREQQCILQVAVIWTCTSVGEALHVRIDHSEAVAQGTAYCPLAACLLARAVVEGG